MLDALRAIPSEQRVAAGARVCGRVVALPEFVAAQRVAGYAALASELPTVPLLTAAAALGKELLWPRLARSGRLELAAARIDELVSSGRGFLAPPDESAPVQLRSGDLLIVPGVAYTTGGSRLGRGGGHYDALIAASSGAITLGVAFDIQLVREMPLEPHDRCVDLVITPSGVWRTK